MGWTVEMAGGPGNITRFVWFKGYIYAFTHTRGVWRRDGIGPWVQVFVGVGKGWYWEADDALYCGGDAFPTAPWDIYRSTDGVAWVFDGDLGLLGSGQGSWIDAFVIGGYGDYLYVANHDVGGAGATYFYRRNLAGVWANFGAPHAGAEGASGLTGIIEFGGTVYWINGIHARYWDGAAWSIEATLDAQGSRGMSLIDNRLYVQTSTSHSYIGGYFWKTAPVTDWTFLNLPVPDNTWAVWTLCEGEDGETYTLTTDGTVLRIYQKVGGQLNLISYQATTGVALGTRGGICTDATGEMFWGTSARFFHFVGVYTVTPGGLYPQAIDCDGDGDQLYLGLYDTGTTLPMLISVPTPLDGALSMGSDVFSPAVGTRINVQCTVVGDHLAIAGNFAAQDDHVRTSDDAGLTWTNIGSNTWNANVAQPLEINPATIDEVMVCLNTAPQPITETFDAGTTWTARANVGYTPGALALLPNGDELIIGDDGGNVVEYSPNRGDTLTNITAPGFAGGGNVAALEIT